MLRPVIKLHFTLTNKLYRKHLFEDISLVCDDHLAPTTGRKSADANETVHNIRMVNLFNKYFYP